MDLNLIKKSLYKEKPIAEFVEARRDGLRYVTKLESGFVYFLIPFADVGDGASQKNMNAQFLNKWIETEKSDDIVTFDDNVYNL